MQTAVRDLGRFSGLEPSDRQEGGLLISRRGRRTKKASRQCGGHTREANRRFSAEPTENKVLTDYISP